MVSYLETGTLWRKEPSDLDVGEIVVSAVWGYVDPRSEMLISSNSSQLFQVSLTYFPKLREWALLYFDADSGGVYWYGEIFREGEDLYAQDQVLEAWEDHLDCLLDQPYTEPTE